MNEKRMAELTGNWREPQEETRNSQGTRISPRLVVSKVGCGQCWAMFQFSFKVKRRKKQGNTWRTHWERTRNTKKKNRNPEGDPDVESGMQLNCLRCHAIHRAEALICQGRESNKAQGSQWGFRRVFSGMHRRTNFPFFLTHEISPGKAHESTNKVNKKFMLNAQVISRAPLVQLLTVLKIVNGSRNNHSAQKYFSIW